MKYALHLFILLLLAPCTYAQKVKTLKLKNQEISYHPKNMRISAIVDDRADTTNIGSTKVGIIGKTTTINLQNGAASELYRFISKNVQQKPDANPIEMHITQLQVSEESAIVAEKTMLNAAFAFYSNKTKLFEYTGKAYTQSSYDATMYLSGMLKDLIESAIKQADEIIPEYTGNDNNSDPADDNANVTVNAQLSQTPVDNDYLAYNPYKTLKIEDFDGKPDELSLAAGATYSTIHTAFSAERMGNKTKVLITVTPLFDRTHSWLKNNGKNVDILLHEHLHFEITAIYAAKLAAAIRSFKFSPENYDVELSTLYKQYRKENEDYQQQYDAETKHGTIKLKQKEWQNKIATEISASEYYNPGKN